MACFSGPEIPNDGLVFCYDQGNTDKSWKGAPTTNLAKNASNVVDWSVSNLLQSVTRSTIVTDEVYRITSTSGTGTSFRIYFISAVLVNGATYTVSYKYKIISGGPLFRANDWCDEAITRTTTALANNAFYETAVGTRATYDSTFRFLDFEMSNNTVVEIYDLQLEQRSFATPYTSTQIRSNTQALLDMTGQNTITANSLTYASNGSFSFNGTSDYLDCGTNIQLTNNFTLEAWHKNINAGYLIDQGAIGTDPNGCLELTNRGLSVSFNNGESVTAAGNFQDTAGWNNAVVSFSSGSFNFYINGNFDSTRTTSTTAFTPSGILKIGRRSFNTASILSGEVHIVKIYNRVLTALEVKQNFEALRGRYGI